MGQASTAHYAAGHMVLKQCIQQFCTSMVAKKYMFSFLYLLTCRSNIMPKNHWTFGILFDSVKTIPCLFASLDWHT